MKKISVKISAFLRLLLFYISSRSLLINARLVFISYFDSVLLRKGYSGLEHKCLFYRLHLFPLHFWWFVLLSLLVSWFSCLHFSLFSWNFWFYDCFVTTVCIDQNNKIEKLVLLILLMRNFWLDEKDAK